MNVFSQDSIKRKYFYARQGWGVIAPVFGIANFMMLIHLTVNGLIPIWIFAPVFIILLGISLIIIGRHFRKMQMQTDLDLSYYKASEACKTERIMWDHIENMCEAMHIKPTQEFYDRKKILKKIEDGKN